MCGTEVAAAEAEIVGAKDQSQKAQLKCRLVWRSDDTSDWSYGQAHISEMLMCRADIVAAETSQWIVSCFGGHGRKGTEGYIERIRCLHKKNRNKSRLLK